MNEGLSQREATEMQAPAAADEVLLARFVRSRDERAFAELVGRHSALVMSVCRRVLGDSHDAEDAFQATFLVLASRAGAVRRGAALPAWLYGVAFRTSRRLALRRRKKSVDSLLDEVPVDCDPLAELTARHDRHVVDEELNRLPARYRDPLVLHYLEGMSQKAVAAALGETLNAIDGRMKRGRRKLRMRLVARGVSVGGVLTAIALARAAEQASANLVVETVKAGLASAGGATGTGVGSALARQLATEEVTSMTLMATTKIVAAAATVCAIALLGVGGLGVLSAQQAAADGGAIAIPAKAAAEDSAAAPVRVVQTGGTPAPTEARVSSDDPFGAGGGDIDPFGAGAPAAGGTGLMPTASSSKAVTRDVARGLGAPAAQPSTPNESGNYATRSPQEQKIHEALESGTTVEFIEVPLVDVVDFLKDLHNISIDIDTPGLDDMGIGEDTPINANFSGLSLRDTLELMLGELELDYVVRNGVLQITTVDVANSRREPRVYELRHLNGLSEEEVVEIIRATVRPGEWQEDGVADERGSIAIARGALVVTHSQRVHREVADLLKQLARFNTNPQYK